MTELTEIATIQIRNEKIETKGAKTTPEKTLVEARDATDSRNPADEGTKKSRKGSGIKPFGFRNKSSRQSSDALSRCPLPEETSSRKSATSGVSVSLIGLRKNSRKSMKTAKPKQVSTQEELPPQKKVSFAEIEEYREEPVALDEDSKQRINLLLEKLDEEMDKDAESEADESKGDEQKEEDVGVWSETFTDLAEFPRSLFHGRVSEQSFLMFAAHSVVDDVADGLLLLKETGVESASEAAETLREGASKPQDNTQDNTEESNQATPGIGNVAGGLSFLKDASFGAVETLRESFKQNQTSPEPENVTDEALSNDTTDVTNEEEDCGGIELDLQGVVQPSNSKVRDDESTLF